MKLILNLVIACQLTIVNAFQSLPAQQLADNKRFNGPKPASLLVERTKIQTNNGWILHSKSSDNNNNDDLDNINKKSNNNETNNRRSFLTTSIASIITPFITNPKSALAATSAASAATTTAAITSPEFTKELSWPLGKVAFSLLPLAATSTRRATVEECIIEDTIWTHDQIQGVVNVNVPVRQTVVKVRKKRVR